VARHIFQACPVWIHTKSNITSIIFKCVGTDYDKLLSPRPLFCDPVNNIE
jgi:hypothetical protein